MARSPFSNSGDMDFRMTKYSENILNEVDSCDTDIPITLFVLLGDFNVIKHQPRHKYIKPHESVDMTSHIN